MNNRYIGLMSGTSVDGIDAVVCDFTDDTATTIATHHHLLPKALREEIRALALPGNNEIARMAEVDVRLGHLFSQAVKTVLKKAHCRAEDITAIGSHGQTIRHWPESTYPTSIQLTDPNIIAANTGITTVADFRRRDIALGGQGAPLVPLFHQWLFAKQASTCVILNIGGIANITIMSPNGMMAFDTGPGNTLMDSWINKHHNKLYDTNGLWAKQGTVDQALLDNMLTDPYFQHELPKSTGTDYFHLQWLEKFSLPLKLEDTQATLCELSAQSIADAIRQHAPKSAPVFLCGGGAHNQFLEQRLAALLPDNTIDTVASFGVDVDYLEAMAFAWFAKQTLEKNRLPLRAITGASENAILGGVYFA